MIPQSPVVRSTMLAALVLAVALPKHARAQDGYLFKPPIATISFRVGVGGPAANGELFDFFTDQLTLDRSDFRGAALGADFALRATRQLDVVLGVAYDGSTNRSEFNDWTDQDDQPIEQTTTLTRIPVTVGAKYYLLPRGRSLSTHAWVPVRLTPYLTAGAGYMFYDLVQEGAFVDFETLEVFDRRFESSGGGATLHAGAGGEWWFTPRLALNAEGRYSWASGSLDRDFSDFDNVDLRGFQLTTGLSVRF
jgi:opacity protein-like surface antigen